MSVVFDFSSFPVLTTERLRLRAIRHDDAEAIVAIFGSEEAMRFLSHPLVDTLEKAVELINRFNAPFQNGTGLNWGITLHGDDRMIGMCGTDDWNRTDRHVDIGYSLRPSHWGHGYATEAARALVDWCFDQLAVHRIQADCTDGNSASEHVLLKCGFKVEGIWRESCWEHERFVDIKQFGLLRREHQPRNQSGSSE